MSVSLKQPTCSRRSWAWLRPLGWTFMALWTIVSLFMAARWWLNRSARERLENHLSAARRPTSIASGRGDLHSAVVKKTSKTPPIGAIALRDLPLIGRAVAEPGSLRLLANDIAEHVALRQQNQGIIDFVATLRNLGIAVSESMTQAEAAAEYLRQVEKFADVLDEWKRALALGPWDLSQGMVDLAHAPEMIQALLGSMVQAYWHHGDKSAAADAWQTMRLALDRFSEPPLSGFHREGLRSQWEGTLQGGLSLGAWTAPELGRLLADMPEEKALAYRQRSLQLQREIFTEYHIPGPEFLQTYPRNGVDGFMNHFRPMLSTIMVTDQQRADNLALIHYAIDHAFDPFDPATGELMPAEEGEKRSAFLDGLTQSWVDQQYFYGSSYARSFLDYTPVEVVREQSLSDMARLAVAVELHRLQTGTYPAALDTLASHFPNGLPRDIATGQNYRFAPDPDGGFRLWSRGVNQSDDGGDLLKDVAWHQPPAAGP